MMDEGVVLVGPRIKINNIMREITTIEMISTIQTNIQHVHACPGYVTKGTIHHPPAFLELWGDGKAFDKNDKQKKGKKNKNDEKEASDSKKQNASDSKKQKKALDDCLRMKCETR